MQLAATIKRAFSNLSGIIYPNICKACDENTIVNEDGVMCGICQLTLPYTDHFTDPDNFLMEHFYGRVKIEYGAAVVYFSGGSAVQNLIHHLKYEGGKKVGEYFGQLMAYKIQKSDYFKGFDVIIPVPIHSKKLLRRGYNQSEVVANALGQDLNMKVIRNVVEKTIDNESQTHKNRSERQENTKMVFSIKNSESIVGKHVLLIDDVVTTGATLEACAREILQAGASKVSLCCIAMAV